MQPPLVESAPHVLKGVLARAPTDSGRDYLFCSLSLLMTSRQSLSLRNVNFSISLVVQWLRIHLPMLGTWEDSICWGHGEIPYAGDMGRFHMLQSNQVCVPQLLSPCPRTHTLQLRKPPSYSPCSTTRSRCNEKPVYRNERVAPLTTTREKTAEQRRPSTAKNK